MRAAVTTSLNLAVRGSRRQRQENKKTRSQISFAVRLHFTADSHTASRAASSTRSHLPVIRRCPGPSEPVSLAMLTARLVPGRLLRTESGIWTAVVQLAHASHLDLSYRLSGILKVRQSRRPFYEHGRRFTVQTYVYVGYQALQFSLQNICRHVLRGKWSASLERRHAGDRSLLVLKSQGSAWVLNPAASHGLG
jgi:hypothetical protein